MQVIGLAGKARVGKDSIGTHLEQRHYYVRAPMAGPLKAMVAAGLGLFEHDFQTTEQKEAIIPWLGVSYRYLCQTIGTDWGRDFVHPDIWLLVQKEQYKRLAQDGQIPGMVVTDIRFDNEAAWVRSVGGLVVHVLSNREAGLPAATTAHVSEAGVLVRDEDRIVFNYGTLEALYTSVDMLIGDLERAS